MRYIILLGLFLCVCMNVGAQGNFAPDGAVWYYDADDQAITKGWVGGDTVIDGIECRKVLQQVIQFNPNLDPDYLGYPSNVFVYSTPDTVFSYNIYYRKFTPLYIYNVAEGDTVCLPAPVPIDQLGADTVYCFRVDSVRQVQYDTAQLKTVYVTSLEKDKQQNDVGIYTFTEGNGYSGAYAERIGALGGQGILPRCSRGCVPHVAMITSFYTKHIRCYNDTGYAIKRSGACSPLSIPALNKDVIKLAPNPADKELHITFAENTPGEVSIQLIDISGRLIINETLERKASSWLFDVSFLNNGIYTLVLKQDGIAMGREKVLIQH